MNTHKDKNGYKLQEGTPVRLTQTLADYQTNRVFHLAMVNGEIMLTIPLSEFQNAEESQFYSVESVR